MFSGATAHESQLNTKIANSANEKAISTKSVVDNQAKDEAHVAEQTGCLDDKTELRASLSNSVGSKKAPNQQPNAKKGGKKRRNKTNIVEFVKNHEQTEKETTLFEEKGKCLINIIS